MDGFSQGGRECGEVGGRLSNGGGGGLDSVWLRGEAGDRIGELGDGGIADGGGDQPADGEGSSGR